jgi:hypothetical protein
MLAALQDAATGGVSSLISYVDTLIQAGVVLVRKVRASKLYRVNTEHLYPELREKPRRSGQGWIAPNVYCAPSYIKVS